MPKPQLPTSTTKARVRSKEATNPFELHLGRASLGILAWYVMGQQYRCERIYWTKGLPYPFIFGALSLEVAG